MRKAVKRILIGSVVLVVLAGLAWPKLDRADSSSTAAEAPRAAGPLGATGYVVAPAPLADRVRTTGTLRANEQVDLASEVSGKITSIRFREGSRVSRGDLLVKINDADLVAQRQRILYRIRLAEAQVARQEALLDKGGISQQEYDQTLNELNVLQADLQLNEAQIAKTEIHAPFDGILGLRHVSEGSFISPQSRIATLQDVSPIKLEFSLPEKYAGQVRAGSTVRFTVSGHTQAYEATVYAVEPRIDENTRTLQVRAASPNDAGTLLPGAFADVELALEEYADALVVPAIAVIPELGGQKVFVVENGHVQERRVQTGIRTPSTVQIVSGLVAGDTVLTSGLQQARPGLPVAVEITE